jgi:DNA polymerase III sliding clamp (beta) subunit (PCNA family)
MNDPFILLPANLAGLAALTATDATRYAMSGVLVKLTPEGYEIAATDGRRLGVVSGPSTADPLEFPSVPELTDAPPAQAQAVIPAAEWRAAFRSLPSARVIAAEPVLGNVAVHLGEKESLLVTSTGEEANVQRVPNLEGRYPPYAAIEPKGEPVVRLLVNPDYLLSLARFVKDFVADTNNPEMILEVRGPGQPIVIRAANAAQRFLGLLMPMIEQPG